MAPHKTPPKKKSTKKKATPRKAASKRVAKTRVTKPRKREPRAVPEVEPAAGSMLIDLEKARLATGAGSKIGIAELQKTFERKGGSAFLTEYQGEFQPEPDKYQQPPPGVPYVVDDNGDFPSVKMWERVEAPKDEHALNLPLYRRLWNWIKSVW